MNCCLVLAGILKLMSSKSGCISVRSLFLFLLDILIQLRFSEEAHSTSSH